ncbi:MAG: hypothetical protein FJ147_10930 [Deltaproteobacteria bacterium]|nr:hypothetical protein [Deltaproteobacteria bacterium]
MRNWRARLTPAQQRIYDRSVAISPVPLSPTLQLFSATRALEAALLTEEEQHVHTHAQTVVNLICARLSVRTIQVHIQGVRPSNRRGELHGLYTQYAGGSESDSIQVWMRTAKRGQVVAFRTFLRTLLHEVCHHLDYVYFNLRESYHTEGFFQRESSLFYAVTRQPATEATDRPPAQSLSSMVEAILANRQQTGK